MIEFTEKAIRHVKRLQAEDSSAQGAYLRVQVVGGGCSGMSYKLSFETTPLDAQDQSFEKEGIRIVIDSKSALFLNGMTVDYSDGLNGTGFVFNNPNAQRTCGCGTSFSA